MSLFLYIFSNLLEGLSDTTASLLQYFRFSSPPTQLSIFRTHPKPNTKIFSSFTNVSTVFFRSFMLLISSIFFLIFLINKNLIVFYISTINLSKMYISLENYTIKKSNKKKKRFLKTKRAFLLKKKKSIHQK